MAEQQSRPLWETMEIACFQKRPHPKPDDWADVIRAIADEALKQPGMYEPADVVDWLKSEADRAERGEGSDG